MTFSGVFPVHAVKIKINELVVKDIESASLTIDGNVEEWQALDQEGWVRRLMTGKGFTLGCSGKRNVGDAGNDFVATRAFETGNGATTTCSIEFPDATKIEFPCVLNVTGYGVAGATEVAPLEFDILSDGKPTLTGITPTPEA